MRSDLSRRDKLLLGFFLAGSLAFAAFFVYLQAEAVRNWRLSQKLRAEGVEVEGVVVSMESKRFTEQM